MAGVLRIAGLIVLAGSACLSQTTGSPLSFEVASIKPSSAESRPPAYSAGHPELFTLTRETLKLMISFAYDLGDAPVEGGPTWASTKMFDVVAKAPRPASAEEKRLMLRALLAERFQLVCHNEERLTVGYVLALAGNGPKYGPQFHPFQQGDPETAVRPPGILSFHGSLAKFASLVSAYLRHAFPSDGAPPPVPYEPLPVLDATGLVGDYGITVDLSKNRDWGVVLKEQLGLSFTLRKTRAKALIIDSAALPGED